MLNTSIEYKRKVSESREWLAKATIVLTDDTVLTVDSSQIMAGGVTIDEAVSGPGSFDIGSAVISKLTLVLNNINDEFSTFDFFGATVDVQVGLTLSERVEWLRKGFFTVDEAKTGGGQIVLTALDNLQFLDVPFSDVSISFPCEAVDLLNAVCTHCGITLGTQSFTNSDFVIKRRPDDEAITCREIASWIAQIAGCFVRTNVDGDIELKWYDTGAFFLEDAVDGGKFDDNLPYATGDAVDGGSLEDYSTGDAVDGGTFETNARYHHIYSLFSQQIATDDIVITGIKVIATGAEYDYDESFLFGENGYVIQIQNPLIQEGQARTIAETVGAKIVGMSFRPLSVTAMSDPSIEAGDPVIVSDRKWNSFRTFVTHNVYRIGNSQSISCEAESPNYRASVRFSEATKAIIESRRTARQEISAYNVAVQRLTNLMMFSFGVFKTEEVQEDGSTIFYLHDKPTLEESQTIWKLTADAFAVSTDGGETYAAGFDSEGNAVFNVLSAIGINADWIRTGTITSPDGKVLINLDTGVIELRGNTTIDGTLVMRGNINMGGNITWDASNSPVKVQYSTNSSDGWHDNFQSGDRFARYSYDGGQTWTLAVKIVGDDGRDGSDATVPGYITSTVIGPNEISANKITGNVINVYSDAGTSRDSGFFISDMTYVNEKAFSIQHLRLGVDNYWLLISGPANGTTEMNFRNLNIGSNDFDGTGTIKTNTKLYGNVDFSNATVSNFPSQTTVVFT